jgi:ABC-type transport system involved in cytochrome bd biosynthesis fused ATPase/permease subunit
MIQDTLDNRLLALLDILVKGVSFLLVLFLIVLMIIGAPMTMLAGVAMLTAVINWPLMAYRRKQSNKTGM